MKKITNWRNATVADLESNGLLREATYIHVLALNMSNDISKLLSGSDTDRLKAFFQWHIKEGVPVVFHNGICFDVPLCEKILDIDLSKLMVIDTLALSWYLNTKRGKHGLEGFHKDYGIRKPSVSEGEWNKPERLLCHTEDQHKIELLRHEALMEYRCDYDVRINKALWVDLQDRLIDMYTKSKEVIDSGEVGGSRVSEDEVIYLDKFRNTTSVDEWIDELLTFLMMKMDNVRIREATMWEADVDSLTEFRDRLTVELDEAKETLESVMPKVPKYTTKSFPKKPVKKGKKKGDPEELSASGIAWNNVVESLDLENDLGDLVTKRLEGSPESVEVSSWFEGKNAGVKVKTLHSYKEPNAGSPDQLKNFLYKHGWIPENFDLVEDKVAMKEWEQFGKYGKRPEMRKVPQISIDLGNGKELCPSVVKLAEEVPEILAYQKYTTIKHRRDMVKGWLENLVDGKYLIAGCGGFTSSLREAHRNLVNIVGVDKLYGKDLRGGLIAGKGNISLGSDLSSLEDRVKHCFMLPLDPEYVETMMADDYDPHLLTAYSAGMISKSQFDGYKEKTLSEEGTKIAAKARKAGKATNYSSVYGAGAPTIARSAGVSEEQGKKLHKGYWDLNWSVKAIADEQVVIESGGLKWLVNPVNGLCYLLRTEKDRFSALCQGTGSYFFDIWVDNVMSAMFSKWGVKRINGMFHDEYVTTFKDLPENREAMEEITHKALEDVNDNYLLRRKLGCDVQFGTDYSQIH